MKTYRGDKWTKAYQASAIPVGAAVAIVRNFPRRRVLVEYAGRRVLTFQWCLRTNGVTA